MNLHLIHFRTFLIMLCVAFTLLSCTNLDEESNSDVTNAKENTQAIPDQESWDSKITLTKNGLRVAEVKSGYLGVFNATNKTVLRDQVKVDFYDRKGFHNSILTSNAGEINNRTEDLRAYGNVVVVSDSGYVLKSEELLWDNNQQKIISNVPVIFMTETDTLYGDTFVSDPKLKDYEMKNARGYSRRDVGLDKKIE